MLKFQTIELKISDHQILRTTRPLWEIPILEIMHDREPVNVIDAEVLIDREPPNANDEFQRLANLYGLIENADGSKGLPYVATVYGQFGMSKLEQAIRAATVTAPVDNTDLLGDPVSSVGG